jgi:hypothetical protein
MTGFVGSLVNAGNDSEDVVSSTVTITDLGVRRGVLVFQPQTGGQWIRNFSEPILVVEAAGSTPDEAARLRDEAVARIATTLQTLQTTDGVPDKSTVTYRKIPEDPIVRSVSGSPMRAAAIVGVLGLWATVVGCVLIDHLVLRGRRSRVEPAPAEPVPVA